MTRVDDDFIEKLIVKGALESPHFISQASTVLDTEYFDDPTAAETFAVITEHYLKYSSVPSRDVILSSIKDKDKTKDLLKEVDAVQFDVDKEFAYLFDVTNKYIKDKAIKNAILDSVDIINKSGDPSQIRSLIESALSKDLTKDLGTIYFSSIAERLRRIVDQGNECVPSYFPTLDEIISGGFPPYTFSVIIATIHGFKSNTMVNMAARQALEGKTSVIFTLEMSEDAFAQRLDAIYTKSNINRMYVSRTNRRKLVEKIKGVLDHPNRGEIYIKEFPTGKATVNDYRIYLKELAIRNIKPDVIYIDYINLMKSEEKMTSTNTYLPVKSISEECRALGLEFNCPIISVSQVNREAYGTIFSELNFSHVSESMGVPATADFMMAYGLDELNHVYKNEVHSIILKNRLGGQVGQMFKFYFDDKSLKMYDESEVDEWMEDAGGEREVAPRHEVQTGRRGRRP